MYHLCWDSIQVDAPSTYACSHTAWTSDCYLLFLEFCISRESLVSASSITWIALDHVLLMKLMPVAGDGAVCISVCVCVRTSPVMSIVDRFASCFPVHTQSAHAFTSWRQYIWTHIHMHCVFFSLFTERKPYTLHWMPVECEVFFQWTDCSTMAFTCL